MSEQYQEVMIALENQPVDQSEILIAQLSELGYDGFMEEPGSLNAYIAANLFNQELLDEILNSFQLKATISKIDKQNWNSIWESNFNPMQVDEFVGVRASFHEPFKNVAHELIITPKMSFGTGHHGTTYAVMKLMESLQISGKKVVDFGTGTGILAILAEKLGASSIVGIDNDHWCIENAIENVQVNKCTRIRILLSDTIILSEKFDIVIANINRHILEANMLLFPQIISSNGVLILSGLLESDELEMIQLCKDQGFKHKQTLAKDGWVAIHFTVI